MLLVVDGVALPSVDVSYADGLHGASVTARGIGGPDGFLGWLAVLVALAAGADLGLERLTTVQLPALPLARPRLRTPGVAAVLVSVALEFALHLDPTHLGFGCRPADAVPTAESHLEAQLGHVTVVASRLPEVHSWLLDHF